MRIYLEIKYANVLIINVMNALSKIINWIYVFHAMKIIIQKSMIYQIIIFLLIVIKSQKDIIKKMIFISLATQL